MDAEADKIWQISLVYQSNISVKLLKLMPQNTARLHKLTTILYISIHHLEYWKFKNKMGRIYF